MHSLPTSKIKQKVTLYNNSSLIATEQLEKSLMIDVKLQQNTCTEVNYNTKQYHAIINGINSIKI